MFRRSKRLIVSIVASSALAVVAIPMPTASAAAGPCVVRATGIAVEDYREVVAVAGEFQAASSGALGVELTCGIVRQGVTVARVTDDVPGPVAVLADTATVLVGSYTACYEVTVNYVEHSTWSGNCP